MRYVLMFATVVVLACHASPSPARQAASAPETRADSLLQPLYDYGIPRDCLERRSAKGLSNMAHQWGNDYAESAANIFEVVQKLRDSDDMRRRVTDMYCGRVSPGMYPSMVEMAWGRAPEATANADGTRLEWTYPNNIIVRFVDGAVSEVINATPRTELEPSRIKKDVHSRGIVWLSE